MSKKKRAEISKISALFLRYLRIALLPMLCVLIFVRVRLVGNALCFELGSHFVETGFILCEKMPCQARAKGENRQQKTPDFGGKKGGGEFNFQTKVCGLRECRFPGQG